MRNGRLLYLRLLRRKRAKQENYGLIRTATKCAATEDRKESAAPAGIIGGMGVATFKIGRKEYVIVPKRRYEQLTQAEQDRKDAEIARKAREAFEAGKLKTISHEALVRKLGL